MKNLFRISTGIMFIMAILIAGGCKAKKHYLKSIPNNTVKIYIRLAEDEITGAKHLEMCDPQNFWVKDSLLNTFVKPGDKVKWILAKESGIEEIVEINGLTGKIFKNKPGKIALSKNFKLQLTNDIDPAEEEEYYIEFRVSNDTKKYKTDPMLRVPPGR